MSMETAAKPTNEPIECNECEGEYVMFEGDKVCSSCGHVCGGSSPTFTNEKTNEWQEWQNHRRENEEYSGWFGDCRIKFIGGFISAYTTEDGALAV